MKLIDGKAIASDIKSEIAQQVKQMLDEGKPEPHLAAILVGDDPASHTYVANKEKACKAAGIVSSVYKLAGNTREKEVLELVDFLNNDDSVDGFIVQLPLPEHISSEKVIEQIDPLKDVDGFHPENFGRMALNLPAFFPATPAGIMEMLERSGIETPGKHCVVVGRSHTVGLPLSILLGRKREPGNATVTLCHSKTTNLSSFTNQADILIAAIGRPRFITADMVKKNAVVIDVGIHRIPSRETKSGYRLAGDVDFDEVAKKVSSISPVPGGVGPMTIVSLLINTLKAARKELQR